MTEALDYINQFDCYAWIPRQMIIDLRVKDKSIRSILAADVDLQQTLIANFVYFCNREYRVEGRVFA